MLRSGGVSELLKDGAKIYSGVDESTIRNIEACKQLANITRTSLGPNGMNKMVINHLDKLFVTHDAATIMDQLEVNHPAAKMVAMAAKSQEEEVGDGTNFVVVLAGELLSKAADLITLGLHPSEIVEGYGTACQFALEELEDLISAKIEDVRNFEEVNLAMSTVLSSKLFGYESIMGPIVSRACIGVCPPNPRNFNVDNVRVLKVEGASLAQTQLITGIAFKRNAVGTIKRVDGGKLAVFSCGIEPSSTDTKGVVELHDAEDVKNYNKSEEDALKKVVDELFEAGVNVVVASGNITDMAMHFLELRGIMAVKLPSKFELRRLCKATGAVAMVRLGAPLPEEAGHCDEVYVEEIGETNCVVFNRRDVESQVNTIIVRGATSNMMDDVERAVDDAVNIFKRLCRNPALVCGAGSTEIELALRLKEKASKCPGLDQYSIAKFGEAFEAIPKALAENGGMDSTDILSSLYAAHKAGRKDAGVDVSEHSIMDVAGKVMDAYESRFWGIRLAADTAMNVLRVDQIIMAKPAGGPDPNAARAAMQGR